MKIPNENYVIVVLNFAEKQPYLFCCFSGRCFHKTISEEGFADDLSTSAKDLSRHKSQLISHTKVKKNIY